MIIAQQANFTIIVTQTQWKATEESKVVVEEKKEGEEKKEAQ